MKRVMSMRVTQVRIFQPDELPWAQLRGGAAARILSEALDLRPIAAPQQIEAFPTTAQLVLVGGQLKVAERIVAIENLVLDERRVVLTVAGDSADASRVFETVRNLLCEIDQRQDKPKYEPLVTSEETASVVQLDFQIGKLLSGSRLEGFARDLPGKVETLGAKAVPFLSSVRFHIHYDDLPASLKKHAITLLDKDVVIEWRLQSAIDDNIFYISSPNPSDAHLALVRQLEETLAG